MYPQRVWTARVSARKATRVARALREAGYLLTVRRIRELAYVNAIAEYCEPMDLTAQNEVRRLVAGAAGIM